MVKVFILLGLFVVIMYIYTFVKLKKNREKTKKINSVQEFHNSYQHLIRERKIPENTRTQQNRSESSYRKYVTKYNSSEDYREK